MLSINLEPMVDLAIAQMAHHVQGSSHLGWHVLTQHGSVVLLLRDKVIEMLVRQVLVRSDDALVLNVEDLAARI